MKKTVCILLLSAILFGACSRGDLTVNVIRKPLIKFDIDSASWQAESYSLTGPVMVVVYPSDPSIPGTIFHRFTLQAAGKDSRGNSLLLHFAFDVSDKNRLPGIYNLTYTANRGLSQIQLYNAGSTPAAFAVCPGDSSSAVLQIQKHGPEEKLITGNFFMTLCNTRDTAQKVKIRNGVLTDIHY